MRTSALLTLLSASVLVAGPAAAADEALVEKVVVKNRLFTVGSRFELGVNVGFSLLSRLTEHYTFDATVAYNLGDTFAVELLGGYAYSRHTSLAKDVADQFAGNNSMIADDLSDLWEMTANGVLGLRWQPFYGKLGIFAEVPLHFQFYLWAGGGGALFKRESVVICNHKSGSTCDEFYSEQRGHGLVSLALGFRFFVPAYGNHHSVRMEVRDFSYLDSYLVGVNRNIALTNASSNPTGNGVPAKPGWPITSLVQVHIGYSYMF